VRAVLTRGKAQGGANKCGRGSGTDVNNGGTSIDQMSVNTIRTLSMDAVEEPGLFMFYENWESRPLWEQHMNLRTSRNSRASKKNYARLGSCS
jgi:hypothetical protein